MKLKITRLEKILEDGTPKRVVIGITATDEATGKSSYIDWTADIAEIGKTKSDLLSYIKSYLTKTTNQDEIDRKKAEKAELEAQISKEKDDKVKVELQPKLEKVVIPEKMTIAKNLGNQLKAPKVEYQTLDTLSDKDKEISL